MNEPYISLVPNNCPDGIRVRKEYRDLSRREFRRFRNALRILRSTPRLYGLNETLYDYFVKVHIDNAPIAHNTPQFLPWHRLFVTTFENLLRTVEPNITIPYWDWSYDALAPLNATLFTSNYLPVLPSSDGTGDCRYRCLYPEPHCLIRNYSATNFAPFVDTPTIERIKVDAGTDFDAFRQILEFIPHAIVHTELGGLDGDLTSMISPNDPLFWLHHSMVDKLWYDWQKESGNFNGYSGRHLAKFATVSDKLPPYGLTVYQTLNITDLCYTYQPFSRNFGNSSDRVFQNISTPQVPQSWIEMHGIPLEQFRAVEGKFKRIFREAHVHGGSGGENDRGKSNNQSLKSNPSLLVNYIVPLLMAFAFSLF